MQFQENEREYGSIGDRIYGQDGDQRGGAVATGHTMWPGVHEAGEVLNPSDFRHRKSTDRPGHPSLPASEGEAYQLAVRAPAAAIEHDEPYPQDPGSDQG